MMNRLRVAVGAVLALFVQGVSAQDYPVRAITLVVAFPPGGPTDVAARMLGEQLAEVLKQPVVIANRPGAAGRIGSQMVESAPADGYTLLLANTVTHGMLSAATKPPPYDPVKGFTPVMRLFGYQALMVCSAKLPVRNVEELVAYARSRPNGLVYASSGVGTGAHFAGEMFAAMKKVRAVHVPFSGSAPAMQAVLAGDVDCSFDGLARAQIDAGKVRPIATLGLKRDPHYPDVPTLDEAGAAGFDLGLWQGLLAPAGLRSEVLATLERGLQQALKAPELQERLKLLGLYPLPGTGADLQQAILRDISRYQRLARELAITFE
ncbi:Bug family tripartite tricarboxylate transporter substrate binding protein [Rubrivivax sp. RP6-9]|uniref:Bug family tripartite tricarboxylate transporter substrate binding protein n=1 Tax=Rubrivivax sp. RP6-9 TaxID=3415750 RepID=UPI003CC66B0B